MKKEFGQNLKKIRKSRELTQEQLAELVGIHPRQISKIETGEHFPTAANIENLCKALNINVYELFSYDTKTKKTNKLIKKIEELSKDKSTYEFFQLVINSLYNNEDIAKLQILLEGMKLSRK